MIDGERLRAARRARDLTQTELAELVGISMKSIAAYERGIRDPGTETVAKMAEVLGVTSDHLMGAEEQRQPTRIPVLGRIPAGIPLEAIEEVLDWEDIPARWLAGGKEYFSLRVRGDSMYPEYLDGDTIILRKTECCETGDDCAVMVNGDDATFKRVRLSETGMVLQPLNPAYEPIIFTAQQVQDLHVRILGVVVELRRTKRR